MIKNFLSLYFLSIAVAGCEAGPEIFVPDRINCPEEEVAINLYFEHFQASARPYLGGLHEGPDVRVRNLDQIYYYKPKAMLRFVDADYNDIKVENMSEEILSFFTLAGIELVEEEAEDVTEIYVKEYREIRDVYKFYVENSEYSGSYDDFMIARGGQKNFAFYGCDMGIGLGDSRVNILLISTPDINDACVVRDLYRSAGLFGMLQEREEHMLGTHLRLPVFADKFNLQYLYQRKMENYSGIDGDMFGYIASLRQFLSKCN